MDRRARSERPATLAAVPLPARAGRTDNGDRAAAPRARRGDAGGSPLAIDIEAWLARGQTGWDAFPNTGGAGKIDAEVGPLAEALGHPNVTLMTGTQVLRLETDPQAGG